MHQPALCISALRITSQPSLCQTTPVVVLILEMDCAFAVISNEWETGCSQSKASTDSDALTPAPQITQHCYLPEDTISETHQKFCLWSRSAHMHAHMWAFITHIRHIHQIAH